MMRAQTILAGGGRDRVEVRAIAAIDAASP